MSDKEYSLCDAIDLGLKTAEKKGASQCEGFGVRMKELELEVEKGRPRVVNGIDKGVSFRVIYDNNIGFAYSKSLEKESLLRTISNAIDMAKVRGPDKITLSFPEPKKQTFPLQSFDESTTNLDISQVSDYYEQLKQPCDESKLNFLGGQIFNYSGTIIIHNSLGVEVTQKISIIGGYSALLSMKGLIPSWGFDIRVARSTEDLDWAELGQSSVSETRRGEAPKTINYTGEVPVIFEPNALNTMMGGLLSVLETMLKGDSIYRNESYFTDRLGEQIASENFSFYDNPFHEFSAIAVPYDMEGTPSQNVPLIEKGVLKNYLLDQYYSQKLDTESNGKCIRFQGGFDVVKQPPGIGSYNMVIRPGTASLDEMISETPEGFSIRTIMGVHMSDFASGRFSVTGSGFYIKNGEIKYPVQDITISGTIPDLLKKIDMIGKEGKASLGSVFPAIRVNSLKIVAQKMDKKQIMQLLALKVLTTFKLMKNPIVAD
ncbi:MAG: TldD/PmbA family protein [Candidatus Hodarchaeales archaeon]